MLLSNWKEVVRTTRAAPTVFILARMRCSSVVLTFRKPLQASRWFPYVEETGGKDLPFERKTPGGCSDSAYRRPSGYRG